MRMLGLASSLPRLASARLALLWKAPSSDWCRPAACPADSWLRCRFRSEPPLGLLAWRVLFWDLLLGLLAWRVLFWDLLLGLLVWRPHRAQTVRKGAVSCVQGRQLSAEKDAFVQGPP